jgi:hypothetical protein
VLIVILILFQVVSDGSLVVYRISTRACHFTGRARAGFDSPPGSFFFALDTINQQHKLEDLRSFLHHQLL